MKFNLSLTPSVTLVYFVAWIASSASPSSAQESSQPTREANKLKALRTVLLQREFSPVSPPERAYCTQLMRDFLADREIVAVEPDVRADSEDDPALKKWHQCDNATPEKMQTIDPKAGFDSIQLLGGPPFRYYRIDIDGNPKNGKEDLLYHELTRGDLKVGATGYTWVNLDGCFIKGGAPIIRSKETPPNFLSIDLVARYKGEYVVFDLYTNSRDPNILNYRLTMYRLNQRKPVVCAWHEPVSK